MGFGKTKIDQADRLMSIYVRLRDKYCLRCGSPVQFNEKGLPITHQASHFQGRGKESTRFDPENVCTLDGGCHQYFTANPGEHYQWQVERFGEKKVKDIITRSNVRGKKDRKMHVLALRKLIKDEFGVRA